MDRTKLKRTLGRSVAIFFMLLLSATSYSGKPPHMPEPSITQEIEKLSQELNFLLKKAKDEGLFR